MSKNWMSLSIALLFTACSGGAGDHMTDEQVTAFADPGMQQAASLLLDGQHTAAVDAAKRSGGLDTLSRDERTLLLIAIGHNDRAGVRALLAAGANPNIPTKKAPIAAAAERADSAIVADLLNARADPDGKVGSEAALWRAAVRSNFEIADMLLKHGAKIDAVNAEGETPAMAATQAAKYRMAVYLLQHGASPLAKSFDGNTLAEWATEGKMHPETEEGRARQQLYAMLRQAGAMQ